MVGWGKGTQGMIVASLSLLLGACGGGSADESVLTDVSLFAQQIGLTAAPSTADNPGDAAPSPNAAPPPIREFANARWVDYQNGSDTNDGRTKASAWKHAPGDPEATGTPAAYRPAPGDQIVFAAGSHYFGSIAAQFTGSETMPIVLTGESETDRAVIDGSSFSASAQKCPSQSACHGIAAWREASIAVFDQTLPEDASIYAEGDLLTPAQWPDPEDLFYAGEVSRMADVPGTAIGAGAIDLPAGLQSLAFEPGLRVALWVQPNVIQQRPVTAIVGGKILFDSSGLVPYLDRTDKFALRGTASLISVPGEFAILPDRKTVIFKSSKAAKVVTASIGRSGIDLSGASNVVVENLTFQNFSDNEGNNRSGLAVWALRIPATNITVQKNIFCNLFLTNGQGAITIQRSNGVNIRNNSISTVAEGSGMRLSFNSNLLVERNYVERLGRTGIYMQSNTDSLVVRNRVRDVFGVHGNGMSFYLGNVRTKVIANTVTEATRPMTFHGNGDADPAMDDLLIANNLLVTVKDSLGALVTYGRETNNVRIINNVILGASKGSLRLSELDNNLRVERNVIDGITFNGEYRSDWTIRNNVFPILGVFQDRFTTAVTTSGLNSKFDDTGAAPSNLAGYCRHISEPLDLIFGTRYDRNIGSDFTCP